MWAYLGPRKTPPPMPDLEGNMQPNTAVRARDPAAVQLAADPRGRHRHHPRRLPPLRRAKAEEQIPGSFSEYQLRQDRSLRSHRHRRRRGLRRPAPAGENRSTGASPSGASRSIRSPRQACSAPRRRQRPRANGRLPRHDVQHDGVGRGRPADRANPISSEPMQPNTTDWYGRFRPSRNSRTTSCIDREAQRRTRAPRLHGHQRHRACRTRR